MRAETGRSTTRRMPGSYTSTGELCPVLLRAAHSSSWPDRMTRFN